jgi:hypothetical protein
MAEGIVMDLVVGVRAEGIKTEVGWIGLGRTWGVVELGTVASLNRLIYKNNSKILFRKLI